MYLNILYTHIIEKHDDDSIYLYTHMCIQQRRDESNKWLTHQLTVDYLKKAGELIQVSFPIVLPQLRIGVSKP